MPVWGCVIVLRVLCLHSPCFSPVLCCFALSWRCVCDCMSANGFQGSGYGIRGYGICGVYAGIKLAVLAACWAENKEDAAPRCAEVRRVVCTVCGKGRGAWSEFCSCEQELHHPFMQTHPSPHRLP